MYIVKNKKPRRCRTQPKVKTWNPGGKMPENITSPLNVKDMRRVRRSRRQGPLINLLVLHYSRQHVHSRDIYLPKKQNKQFIRFTNHSISHFKVKYNTNLKNNFFKLVLTICCSDVICVRYHRRIPQPFRVLYASLSQYRLSLSERVQKDSEIFR